MNTYHSFRELGQLKWLGDHKIDRFKNHLNHILADVGQQMSDRAKCDFLLPIWDESELLSDEARHWRRLPANDPEKNFQWMLDSMDRISIQLSESSNIAARRSYLSRGADGRQAPAQEAPKQPGGGGKGGNPNNGDTSGGAPKQKGKDKQKGDHTKKHYEQREWQRKGQGERQGQERTYRGFPQQSTAGTKEEGDLGAQEPQR